MHIHRMSGWTFTDYDDMMMGLTADRIRNHGWQAYYRLAKDYALWQGRAYFFFSMFFFVLPFFLRSLLLRAVCSALVQLSATCALGAVLGLYTGFRTAALFVALVCAMLPYWRAVSPVNGYPFIYHMPVLLFFAALTLHICWKRGYVPAARQRLCQMVSWTAFVVSLFYYEALIPLFCLIALVVSAAEARRAYGKWTGYIAIRTWTPWLTGFVLWSLVYLGFRRFNPSTYGGSTVSGIGPHDLGAVGVSLYYFETFSLPGANWIGNLSRTLYRWTGTPESLGYVPFFWRNLTADGIALAVLVAGLAACWCALNWKSPAAPEAPPRRLLAVAGMALACAILAPFPLEFTPKYRTPQTIHEVLPYLTGYYSFLGWCAAIALAFPLIGYAWRNRPAMRVAATALLALVCAVVSAANAMSNQAIYREVADLSDKWKLVDRLARTDWFAKLPRNAVFMAPGLWDTFPEPTWFHADPYWSEYFSGWAGRPVRVIREVRPMLELLDRQTPVFYCEHLWLPGRLDAVLVVHPIQWISPADGNAMSDSTLLISRYGPGGHPGGRPANLVVEYRSPASAVSGAAPPRVPVTGWRYEHGAYLSQASTPGLIVGTARVSDQADAPLYTPTVDVRFQRGFTPATERDGEQYFRWSDGKDGEGELNLVNFSSQPLRVRFRASLHFNQAERRAVFDFRLPQGTETLTARPGQTIERIWQLAPGANRILVKCHAGRLPAPGDRRYIVFGIWNWSAVPVG